MKRQNIDFDIQLNLWNWIFNRLKNLFEFHDFFSDFRCFCRGVFILKKPNNSFELDDSRVTEVEL